jgi:hypothetical protein
MYPQFDFFLHDSCATVYRLNCPIFRQIDVFIVKNRVNTGVTAANYLIRRRGFTGCALMSFLAELKRSNVERVLIAYPPIEFDLLR